MLYRSLCRGALALASLLGCTSLGFGAEIPAKELFFAPSSFVEAVYPERPVSGDGEVVPWTLTWTTRDILALDPGRIDVTITGAAILPILVPNPNTEEGEYADADLAAITADNYLAWYAFYPGASVYKLNCHYDADLTNNVLTVHIVAPGPYTFRVHTMSRASRGAPLEAVDYTYSQLIGGDAYSILADADPVPATVQRMLDVSETPGGVAGAPPGVVHVVSDGDPNPNKYLPNTLETLTDEGKAPQKANTIAVLVQKVCDAVTANGGAPVKVVIHAHGNGPAGGQASGSVKIGTELICTGLVGCTKTPKQVGEMLKGKASSITLVSCYTGSDAAFTTAMANASMVNVTAFAVATTAANKSTFLGWVVTAGYFDTAAKGKKKKTEPQGCAGGNCLGDISPDSVVDSFDLATLLGQWGEGGCADFNDDGTTDGADLGVLLNAWGACS